MKEYRIQVTIVKNWFDEETWRLTNVYNTKAATMDEALGRASRYADHQMEEEHGDFIKHISVTEVRSLKEDEDA